MYNTNVQEEEEEEERVIPTISKSKFPPQIYANPRFLTNSCEESTKKKDTKKKPGSHAISDQNTVFYHAP